MTPRQARQRLCDLIGSGAEFERFAEGFQAGPLLLSVAPHVRQARALLGEDAEAALTAATQVLLKDAEFIAPSHRAGAYAAGMAAKDSAEQFIEAAKAQGFTMRYRSVETAFPGVALAQRALELLFATTTASTLYWSPRGHLGLDLHYDTHHVLVFQLSGRKQWRVEHDAALHPNPWWRLSDEERAAHGEYGRYALEEGDMLYIPAGHRHQAEAEPSGSLHLTIGFRPLLVRDAVHAILDYMSDRELELRTLAFGLVDPRSEAWDLELADAPWELAERKILGGLAQLTAADGDTLRCALRMRRAVYIKELPALPRSDAATEVSAHTWIGIRDMTIGEVIVNEASATLYFPGGQMSGPTQIGPALHYILHHERFRPADLPGSISEKSKIILVQKLMRQGLVEAVKEPARRTGAKVVKHSGMDGEKPSAAKLACSGG